MKPRVLLSFEPSLVKLLNLGPPLIGYGSNSIVGTELRLTAQSQWSLIESTTGINPAAIGPRVLKRPIPIDL